MVTSKKSNGNKWVYTADLEIKLNVKLKGPGKNKKTRALEILQDPKTYDMMLYPDQFDAKNVKITVNKSCTMVTLSIKDVKLLYLSGISIPKTKDEILDELNNDLHSSLSDGWGESGIVFGESRWEYSSTNTKSTPVNSKNISKMVSYLETYWLEGKIITLPPHIDPTKEYSIPKDWCKKKSVINSSRPHYFYKNLELYYSKHNNNYTAFDIPKMFDKLKKDFSKLKGEFVLPKKLESKVEKHTEYLSCKMPSKYTWRVYPKDKLPKEIPKNFFRLDKHPKNKPYYFIGDRQVYKTEPNWIWWDSGKIVRVENVRKK